MTGKKKLKIVVLAAAAILLLGSGLFTIVRVIEYNQTSVSLEFIYHDGPVSKLPIPKGSRVEAPFSVNGLKLKTFCTEQEVKAFYQDYFDTLPRVRIPGHYTEAASKTYYDESQQLIIYDDILFMNEWDGLHFAVMYEPYGDGAGVRVMEEPKK